MLNWIIWIKTVLTLTVCIAKSAGAVEYTECTSESPVSALIYDTKQSDGEVPVMLGTWGEWSTSSLPLLSGPL